MLPAVGTLPAEWSSSVCRPPCRAWAALLLPHAQGLPRAGHTQHASLGERRWGPSGHSHGSFPLLLQGSIKDTAFGSTTSQRTTIMTMTARSTSSVSVRTLPPPVCGMGDWRRQALEEGWAPWVQRGQPLGAPDTPL